MDASCLYIKKTQLVRKNKPLSVDKNKSEKYSFGNSINAIPKSLEFIFNSHSNQIWFLSKKNYRKGFNALYSSLKTGISQFKLFTRKVAVWALKNPALGFVDFLADTYCCLNQSEYKYVYETKFSKYCFLFKYCFLSFISFYF
jgi:hypothetical protein